MTHFAPLLYSSGRTPSAPGAGLDIGSTTVKATLVASDGSLLYSSYRRHYSNVRATALELSREIAKRFPIARLCVTGSGGLDISREIGCEFLQEVSACRIAVETEYADIDIALELGGEDAKITYLTGGLEQRMNETCAGGTGAFIDQMAAFLHTDAAGLDDLAAEATEIYPIASRCGVFAKSDILPLLNEGRSRENIAASIIQAVVNQTISGLAQGRPLKGNIIFLGGPLRFLRSLRAAFARSLPNATRAIFPENGHFFPSLGAAIHGLTLSPLEISPILDALERRPVSNSPASLPPLFASKEEYATFKKDHSEAFARSAALESASGEAWLGIDCGSTTVKCALIDAQNRLLYQSYASGGGEPLEKALSALREIYSRKREDLTIVGGCAAGYGGGIVKAALNLDIDIVETVAHFRAARFFNPNVSYILDIGGQDIKCMSARDGFPDKITLNEACSSGCGSFIENFAASLNLSLDEFVSKALFAPHPVDLGVRCAVFMNSRVRQAQKEGSEVADIAAGLCYSVVRNALRKVIMINDLSLLGDNVVVQGGAFYNDAILRALELELGAKVVRSDMCGLAGAFGAALIAKDKISRPGRLLSPDELENFKMRVKKSRCKGCGNSCSLSITEFPGKRIYASGNRCEKPLAKQSKSAPNLFAWKYDKLFRETKSAAKIKRGVVGVPRALNMYENYPFWRALLTELGFDVVLSPPSSRELFLLGCDTIPSQTVCYPAKLVHGHIRALIKNNIKTIFYPSIRREQSDADFRHGLYNCPVVSGYPELVAANIPDIEEHGVNFINDFFPLSREMLPSRLARSRLFRNIPLDELSRTADMAFASMENFRRDLRREGEKVLRESNGRPVVVLAGHPYHIDPEICGGVAEFIASCGAAVVTVDSLAHLVPDPGDLRVVNQWAYHSLLYRNAALPAKRPNISIIQLVSFGCGLDAIAADQTEEIVVANGGLYARIKIDEGINLAQARIRVRSLLASMEYRKDGAALKKKTFSPVNFNTDHRSAYKYLIPQMSPIHFQFAREIFAPCGYDVELLAKTAREDREAGIKYVNNDVCYPAILLVGQLINAVKSGRYDKNRIAVVLSQTGGVCRATNYAALLRKALDEAGLSNVPVAGFRTTLQGPGIRMDRKLTHRLIMAGHYGDALNRIIHRLRPYEKEEGATEALAAKWIARAAKNIESGEILLFNKNIWKMISEFDRLPLKNEIRRPRAGIVGEILLKYHPFANNDAIRLLENEGAEVVTTDIMDFMMYCLYREIFDYEKLDGSLKNYLKARAGIAFLEATRKFMTYAFSRSARFSPPAKFAQILRDASSVISLGQQAGEGWLLGGEMVKMIKNGVASILSLQPFGCLPNHIAARGIIRRLKKLFPGVSISALDYDPGASETNQINRIKLLSLDFRK